MSEPNQIEVHLESILDSAFVESFAVSYSNIEGDAFTVRVRIKGDAISGIAGMPYGSETQWVRRTLEDAAEAAWIGVQHYGNALSRIASLRGQERAEVEKLRDLLGLPEASE